MRTVDAFVYFHFPSDLFSRYLLSRELLQNPPDLLGYTSGQKHYFNNSKAEQNNGRTEEADANKQLGAISKVRKDRCHVI